MITANDIRALRQHMRLSQSEFADRLGVTQSRVSRLEKEQASLSQEEAIAIEALHKEHFGTPRGVAETADRASISREKYDEVVSRAIESAIQKTGIHMSNKSKATFIVSVFEELDSVLDPVLEKRES